MATDAFTGTAATALATHDAAWTANTDNDGITGLQLDGSGNLTWTGSSFNDVFYNGGGTGSSSKSHATFPAGDTLDALGNVLGVGCRMNTTQRGYQAFLKSSTNVNTNFDQIGVRRNGAFLATLTLDAAINLNTTAVDLTIQVVNTVDLEVTVNSRVYTKADKAELGGSGGNDGSGAAVLTGGFPGLLLYHNSGTPVHLVSNWTDDAAGAAANVGLPRQGQGAMGVQVAM